MPLAGDSRPSSSRPTGLIYDVDTILHETQNLYLSTANFRPLLNGYGYLPLVYLEIARVRVITSTPEASAFEVMQASTDAGTGAHVGQPSMTVATPKRCEERLSALAITHGVAHGFSFQEESLPIRSARTGT